MKILVLGAGGQVGSELRRFRWPDGYRLAAPERASLDIVRRHPVFAMMARERPHLVINAAAYTAVDRAESEPEAAWAVNCDGPGHLAEACREAGVPLVHLSTDYVFDGTKDAPYREDDPVNPLGVYGRSKEAGERAVRDALDQHVILRTAWVYSVYRQNFVKTMLRLAAAQPALRVVADQHGAPTAAADIAAALARIAARIGDGEGRWGTYHFTDAGAVSWHGFAEAIFAAAARWQAPPVVSPIATAEYPTPARRPANSVLDCTRIAEAYRITPRPWRDALAEVVGELFEGAPDAAVAQR
jgi:dTDP-4-dehydrorhamnose reductase